VPKLVKKLGTKLGTKLGARLVKKLGTRLVKKLGKIKKGIINKNITLMVEICFLMQERNIIYTFNLINLNHKTTSYNYTISYIMR
jgi:hypothetical protein